MNFVFADESFVIADGIVPFAGIKIPFARTIIPYVRNIIPCSRMIILCVRALGYAVFSAFTNFEDSDLNEFCPFGQTFILGYFSKIKNLA
ncbi:hypothetical protein J7L68_08835 [bacterium]|nr:hypothetical protein [bacterium]